MGHLRYFVCSVAGTLALQSPAAAQERKLDFGLTALLLYDSNFARSSEAQAVVRGIQPEELRFSPALTADAEIPIGRHLFSVRATAGYDFHLNNPRFDRERLEGRAGFRAWLGRCASTLEGIIARRQTELEDIIIGPTENVETVKEIVVGASCDDVAGIVPAVELSGRWSDNSSAFRQTTDSHTRRAIGRLNYVQRSLGEIGIFAELAESDYPNRFVPSPFGGFARDELEVHTVGISYSREIGALVRGTARVGYTEVDTRSVDQSLSGLTWFARLLVQPEGRLRPVLTAEKSIRPSNRIGISLIQEELYSAELSYLLSARTTLNLHTSVRDRDYGVASGAIAPPLTQEDIFRVGGGLSYRLTGRISLELQLLHEERDSNNFLFDYTSNRIGLTTRASF